MCGIVGYIGAKDPKDVILNGLERLEYRGYDSAGLGVFHQGELMRFRAVGKLSALRQVVSDRHFSGPSGIGHTRWATHGAPSEQNSHPHKSGPILLVHNGIIENDTEIKTRLLAQGVKLESQTDSELVAHLIHQHYQKEQTLLQAVLKVLPELRGAFSIVVMCEDQPDELVAFKDGPPLIVGLGQDEYFVVSDVSAALSYTKDFVYLEDREVVRLHKVEGVQYFSSRGIPLKKTVTHIHWDLDQIEKRGFSHFMLKEIHEQPQAVSQALTSYLDESKTAWRKDIVPWKPSWQRIHIVACGTSYYAGLLGMYLFERWAKIPCTVEVASEFRYRDPMIDSGTLVVTISQSGETADTLAALRLAKQKGCEVLSICNVAMSSIDREADYHMYMGCGPEIGVASTKAFTSTLVHLMSLAAIWSMRLSEDSREFAEKVRQSLLALPSHMESVLAFDKYFQDASEVFRRFRGFLFLGRGLLFPIALEGALKMKELSYLHAEGYAAGEMKHGPLALVDEDMAALVLAPKDELHEKTISNLQEVKARGGKVIAIGTAGDKGLEQLADRFIPLPEVEPWIYPFISVLPLQLLAFHVASGLGYDVDKPRNLAKSVTVE
jgi:glucosamine--fructose-6-phosphate aminotransferase (isomerizing)